MGSQGRAQQVLSGSLESYRSLFELHPHAIYRVDLEGNFVDVNAAAARISSYSPEQLLTMNFADIVVPADLEATRGAFAAAKQSRIPRVEFRITRQDGQVVHLDVTGIPIVVDTQAVGMFGIAEDITARKRTALELQTSRKLMVAADEAKNTFLTHISHDLRTPLTSMLAVTELLADTPLTADQRHLVETLERSGSRLLSLVEDVMDLSRYRNGSAAVETERFNLRESMTSVLATVRPAAAMKDIELLLEVAPDVPEIVEDHPRWTNQVLHNLLENAVKFTDTGTVQLTVSTATTVDRQPSLLFRVRDTGIGIAAERRDEIFHVFTQADATIHARYGGSGLGLTIVRELVTLLGGAIWVDSTPGRGSTFSVMTPIRALGSTPPPA